MIKQLIKDELAEDLATMAAFTLNKTGLNMAHIDDKLAFVKLFFQKVDEKQKMSDNALQDKFILSTLEMLEAGANLTPTQIDDRIVEVAKTLYNFLSINKPFKAWIEKIKAKRQSRKLAKEKKISQTNDKG